jgi:hypothetical protein
MFERTHPKEAELPRGFESPPEIPAKGLAIPPETSKFATQLRKAIESNPRGVPYPLHCWLIDYRINHPYGFARQSKLEEKFEEENEKRWRAEQKAQEQESAAVEEAKGNKTYKVMDAQTGYVDMLAKALNANTEKTAQMVINAVRLGGEIANTARKENAPETKAASDALVGALGHVTTMNEKMFAEREGVFDERAELIQLMKDLQEGKQVEATPGRFGMFVGLLRKAAKVFAPMAKHAGLDLTPLLEEGAEKAPAQKEGTEDEAE